MFDVFSASLDPISGISISGTGAGAGAVGRRPAIGDDCSWRVACWSGSLLVVRRWLFVACCLFPLAAAGM